MLFHPRHQSNKPNTFASDFLYRLLSLQKSCQQGSTLVVAVVMGVIVIGAAGLAIAKANSDKNVSASNEMTQKAVEAAEAGAARIQGFLAENPEMAMVDHTVWASVVNSTSSNASTVADTINSKTGSSSSTSSSSSSTCTPFGASDGSTVTATEVTDVIKPDLVAQVGETTTSSGTQFKEQNIGGNSDTQFRLVSYNPPASGGGTGTLLIRGQYKGSSQAQLQVKLPVKQVPDTSSTTNTGFNGKGAQLWAQNFTASGGGNHTINLAAVADSPNCFPTPSQAKNWEHFVGPGTPSGAISITYGTYDKNVGAFPTLPGNINTAGNQYSKFTEANAVTSTTCLTGTLPRTTDKSIGNNVYAYNMPLNCAVTLDITAGKTIKIFSNNAISGGSVSVKTGTTSCTGNGNNQVCKTTPDSNLGKVIVYGNNGLTIGGNAGLGANNWKYYQFYIANGEVTASGNSDTAGFIFAPNSTVNYKGTSSHFGPIWARTFALTGGGNGQLQGQFTTDDANYLDVNLNTGTSMTYSTGSPTSSQRTPIQ